MSKIRSKIGSYILKRFCSKCPSEPRQPKKREYPPHCPSEQKLPPAKPKSSDLMLPDSMEIITGKEKQELMALMGGNLDPYNNEPVKRMDGSSEKCPNILKSVNCERIVGCFCEEDAFQPFYWKIQVGKPVRCLCGHWFELVQVKKIFDEINDS